MTAKAAATIVAAAGVGDDPGRGALVPPLYMSDTYRWDGPETKPEYDYSRTVNPNRDTLVGALAALEGATGGVATGSGQSAALLALMILPQGSLVVAPHDCYGGTYRLIQGLADQGNIRALFVDQRDDEAYQRAMAQGPALVWFETPSNPLLRLVDIEKRAGEARRAGAISVADNTLPTPLRQKPLSLGCDLVMHSITKALNGHSDLHGGALLANDLALVEKLQWWTNAAGLALPAYDASQSLRGLRTLPLRVDRQEQSAAILADWLSAHDQVADVHYPGLKDHPDYQLAQRQQAGPGFMISLRLKGGVGAAEPFLAALEVVTLASSLGGFASLVCTPASMTHRGMPPEAQERAGIYPDLLRFSIGLEDAEDLRADLERGFSAIA